jgi:rSAM/selenodomain-associated transferase 1
VQRLLIFLKAPLRGQVKTRLCQQIGEQAGLDAYNTILRRLFGNLSPLDDVEVWFSPPDSLSAIQPLLPEAWEKRPQQGRTLGERLEFAFASAFSRGATNVAVIGSDCPYVQPRHISQTCELLHSNDLVLGPALDGGYWLLGLNKPCPKLFQEIPWSSPNVLAMTLERAKANGLKAALLDTLEDIDTADAWDRFRRSQSSILAPGVRSQS